MPSSRLAAAQKLPDLGSPRFELLNVLGEGGSGVVYEARVKSASGEGEIVALKVLRAELAPSERERRRFLEESERMQRVTHPGLVRLLDAGLLPDGRPFLAMPRLEGETLAARLRRGPIPVRTAVRWFAILARAVHALHEAGMVHRDIKPENVILEEDGPVLLDFGIARDLDDESASTTTVEGRVRGTPAYMAPERFFGAPASVRSDVYELAVVLYMMLVGRLPWGSEKNVTERLDPKSPEEASADVNAALAAVILRALSTRPEVRPASAEALAAETLRTLDAPSLRELAPTQEEEDRQTVDLPVVQPAPSLAPKSAPPPRSSTRNKAIPIVLVTTVVVAAFVIAKTKSADGPAPVMPAASLPLPSVVVSSAPTPAKEDPPPSSVPSSVASEAPPASAVVVRPKPPPVRSAPSTSASVSVEKYFEDRR